MKEEGALVWEGGVLVRGMNVVERSGKGAERKGVGSGFCRLVRAGKWMRPVPGESRLDDGEGQNWRRLG